MIFVAAALHFTMTTIAVILGNYIYNKNRDNF
jgi:hypothetical protein